MCDTSVSQKVDQIRAYAKSLAQAARVLDERRHILEPLINDDEIKGELAAKLGQSYGTHAYNHLAPLFAQDIVRDISRLFLDAGKKTASLKNLYRKASDPEILAELKEEFRRIPDKWDSPDPFPDLTEEDAERIAEEWRDKDRDKFEQSFVEGWEQVTADIARLDQDLVAEKIKTFRDKRYAHLEMAPLGKEAGPFDISELNLSFADILAFLDNYMPAIFELTRLLTGNVICIDDFSKHHRRCALDMWRILSR